MPAGTPQPILEVWNKAVRAALADEEVKKKLYELGFETLGTTPQELAAHMEDEYAKWNQVIEDANLKS